jgi:hypothetical protein
VWPASRLALLLRHRAGRPTAWPVPPGPAGTADRPPPPSVAGAGAQPGSGPVPLGHRDQLAGVQTAAGGLADQRGGGLGVAVAGGGGHRQPQPVARRGERPWLGRLTGQRPIGAVAGPGDMAGRRWPAVWVTVLAVVVGWRLDRQMPRQARQGTLGGRLCVRQARAPGRASVGRQERASATIARALAR